MQAHQSPAVAALVRQLARIPGIDGVLIRRTEAAGETELRDNFAAVPIVTTDGVWGVADLHSEQTPFPQACLDAAAGLVEIAAVAIGHAQRCAQLEDSRRRLLADVDATCERIERELHDGVQQRLTTTGMELRLRQEELPAGDPARDALAAIGEQLGEMSQDVRELSRRIFPAILSDGGLAPALRALSRRAALPVELELPTLGRYPAPLEVTIYQVVSQAVEHSARTRAGHVSVRIAELEGRLRLTVTGGDDLDGLSPILRDRIDALSARLDVQAGTIVADFPVPSRHTG